MGEASPDGTDPATRLPVSTFVPSAENFLRQSLDPPSRPGLLGDLDRYEVLRLIGAGGMGLVLLARDTEVRSPAKQDTAGPGIQSRSHDAGAALVAIKMIKPELALDPGVVHRFLKEARHMQRLSHPNILAVLEIADHPQCPYFVMPYIERGSLANLIQRGQVMERARTLAIARQIAFAVAHAHSRGIIHRDLKPSNVLVDEDSRAYLTDFGLARTLFNDSFVDVRLCHCEGTAPYVSPALASGEAEDTRCDVYAFGALLYEMLTSRPPYDGRTAQEILKLIRAGPPRSILELNPAAPRDLVAVAEAAMARELRDRYARMSDVLLDLDCIANHETPSIGLGLSDGAAKRRKSKPLARAVLAAAIAVLILCGVFASNRLVNDQSTQGLRLRVVRNIELPGVWRWSDAKVGRWQLDHEDMLFLQHDDRLLVVSGSGQVMREWRAPDAGADAFRLDLLTDLDGDRLDDPVVSWRAGKALHVAVLNHNLFPLKKFTVEGALQRGAAVETGTSGMTAMKLADLSCDGKRKLLAAVGTGFELKPRGLYCFEYETGELLWSHNTGPYLTEVETIDLDRDGFPEVVTGSHAVDNGNRANDGTDDRHSYVYAFSREGKVLWTRQLEGPFALTHPLAADLDGEGKHALLVWVTASHFYRQDQAKPEVGRILRLDAGGGIVADYDAGAQLISCVLADLDGDRAIEIIATDRNGFLHVLNRDLTLRAKISVTARQYDVVELQIMEVADLDSDGHPELILISAQEHVSGRNQGNPTGRPNIRNYHDNCIIVMSHDLKPLARHVVASTWREDPGFRARVADLAGTGTLSILSLSDKALVLEYEASRK